MKMIRHVWDRSFADWRYRASLHVLFWAFLLFFWMRENMIIKVTLAQHYSVTLMGILLSLYLYYPLVYGIVPLFRRRRWFWAVLASIAYYLGGIVLRTYNIELLLRWYNDGHTWFAGQDFWPSLYQHQLRPVALASTFFSSVSGLLTIIYIPLIVKFLRYTYRMGMARAEAEKEKTRLELAFLKAQLHPHFLFNTLNNLQSFIVHDERDRSVALLGDLADFLRFTLYSSQAEFIPLRREIDVIRSYIAIETARMDDPGAVRSRLETETPDMPVPPLLLLPFIENAFKHSAMTRERSIDIDLGGGPQELSLTVVNTYDAAPGQGHGIGLENARKRLAHYYPGRHRLDVLDSSPLFTVKLVILPHAVSHRG